MHTFQPIADQHLSQIKPKKERLSVFVTAASNKVPKNVFFAKLIVMYYV